MTKSPQRVLSIWLPNWPWQRLAAEIWQRAEDLVKPIPPTILVHQDPRRGRLVATANASARHAGILPGMTVTQAKSFGTKFIDANSQQGEVRWIDHDPQEDIEAIFDLAEQLLQFCPLAGVESLDKSMWAGRSLPQPQALFMDITGLASWYGSEQGLADQLQQWLTQQGFLACLGIGNTVGQAWAISNYAFRKQIPEWMLRVEKAEQRLVDLLAISPRISILDSDTNPWDFFREYPIEALRLDIEAVAKLHRLGIRKLGPLKELPRSSLTSRFGPILLTRIDQCLTGISETISVRSIGEPLETTIDCEPPIANQEHLEQVIEDAICQLCKRLESLGHAAWRVLIRLGLETSSMQLDSAPSPSLHHSRGRAHIIQIGLYQTSDDPKHLLGLTKSVLDRNPPQLSRNLGVKSVLVQIPWTAPTRWKQQNLFDSESLRFRDEAAKLIDNLAARLGRNQVVGISQTNDPVPEHQTKSKPLTGLRNDGKDQSIERKLRKPPIHDYSKAKSIVPGLDGFGTRPIHLLNPAVPLRVELDDFRNPSEVQTVPEPQSTPAKRHRVLVAEGPERIESNWWAGPTIRRNYFRVELDNSLWWWIYQDLTTQEWFLHGLYQ